MHLYPACLINMSCNKPQNIQTICETKQPRALLQISTPLTFSMRLYKCCFHASISFVMGCPSSCTRPLALEFPSRHDSLLPFLPSSKVKRQLFSLLKSMDDFLRGSFSLQMFGSPGPGTSSLSYTSCHPLSTCSLTIAHKPRQES